MIRTLLKREYHWNKVGLEMIQNRGIMMANYSEYTVSNEKRLSQI